MSIVVVAFEGAPKVSDVAVKKEQELDAKIETKIKGIGCICAQYCGFVSCNL